MENKTNNMIVFVYIVIFIFLIIFAMYAGTKTGAVIGEFIYNLKH